MKRIVGFTLMFAAMASIALADNVAAPEIDASSGVTAITLLAGGLVVLRSRRRKS